MEKQLPDVHIQFRAIELLSKSLAHRPRVPFTTNEFEFDFKMDTKVQVANKTVFCVLGIGIRELNDPNVLATFNIINIFEVANLEQSLPGIEENNLFQVRPDLDLFLKSHSLATARGIIYSELKGTYLGHAVMPLIEADSLRPDIVRAKEKR